MFWRFLKFFGYKKVLVIKHDQSKVRKWQILIFLNALQQILMPFFSKFKTERLLLLDHGPKIWYFWTFLVLTIVFENFGLFCDSDDF